MFFETGYPYVVQADLELETIPLPQPPKYCDDSYAIVSCSEVTIWILHLLLLLAIFLFHVVHPWVMIQRFWIYPFSHSCYKSTASNNLKLNYNDFVRLLSLSTHFELLALSLQYLRVKINSMELTEKDSNFPNLLNIFYPLSFPPYVSY